MREQDYNSSGLIVKVLILIIIILVGILVYSFLVKPFINKTIQQKQIDAYTVGQTDLINAILIQLQQTGRVAIPVGNNQSLVLIPIQK